MYKLITNKDYNQEIPIRQTEKAIKLIKDSFEQYLAKQLHLERVSAPMFIKTSDGLNDDLSGIERPVSFDIKEIENCRAEIVHSLAKWKRVALRNYLFNAGEGLYTDMNAVRRDDSIDNIHSIYVDQWDWELVINEAQRNLIFLKNIVRKIVKAIVQTEKKVRKNFGGDPIICEDIFFITSQELEDLYPDLQPKEREHKITKMKKTVFIMQIGDVLKSGKKHDERAPDYDDWKLNGDLLFWNNITGESLELSSMGIRVDSESIKYQLEKANKTERLKYKYHQNIINNKLPLTIGGGIGQSRLCMLILQKLHIGEVQVSIWPEDMIEECRLNNIKLL